jgi:hypothetical protein
MLCAVFYRIMNSLKWLQRKYPNSFEELNEYFDRHEIENFKKSTMKIGRLTKDVIWCQKYKKGSIIQFKRSNPVNGYNHPFVYAILKCQVGYTESGYHSFNITENDFVEVVS